MKNFIYQIHYSEPARAALDPDFIPLDATGQRADWYELGPIRRFLTENTLDPDARYGFLSPEFQQKTSLTGEQVHRFLADTPDDVDVVTFSPYFSDGALFKNMFEQAEYCTPGITPTFEAVIEFIAPGTQGKTVLENLVMSSAEAVYCNYFVATPRFWQSWLAVCEAIFRAAEANDSALARLLNAPTGHLSQVPARALVIERIASLLLSVSPSAWKVRPFDSMTIPDPDVSDAGLRELIELDALKLAAVHTGNRAYYAKFLELQPAVLKRIEAHAQRGQTLERR